MSERELIATTQRLRDEVRAAVREAARLQAQARVLLRTTPRLPLAPVELPAASGAAGPRQLGRGR
jgi:hypothetical protein